MSGKRQLSRLQIVPTNIQEQLQKLGIITVGDLYSASPLQVISYTDLSHVEYRKLLSDVAAKVVPPTISAFELMNQRQERSHFLSTGMPPLDSLLRGGLPIGTISDVCGLPGAGKTQFCMFLTVMTLLQHPGSVIYIDSELKLDSSRLVQILASQLRLLSESVAAVNQNSASSAEIANEDVDSYLQRIVIKRPSSFEDFNTILSGLEEEVITLESPLIVIDSLAAITKRHHFSPNELDRFLISTATTLRRIASFCHCTVLATNQVAVAASGMVDLFGGDGFSADDSSHLGDANSTGNTGIHHLVPALGPTWQHCIGTRFYLVKMHSGIYEEDPDNDPDTSFVFPDGVDTSNNNIDVSVVPQHTRRSNSSNNQEQSQVQTVGRLTIMKSSTVPRAAVLYAISQAGLRVVTPNTST